MNTIVYRDGLCVIATGKSYADIRYSFNLAGAPPDAAVILNQDEARELAATLAWIISEVDSSFGYESFKPRPPRGPKSA